MREGIMPITPEAGIGMLKRLVATKLGTTSIVLTSRFAEARTVRLPNAELPLLRFIEHARVFYPGIELIAEAKLSNDTDPYLGEHLFHGERLFPAVLGLEAFAQAASVLGGGIGAGITFENIRFERPVVAPEIGTTRIRIAALRRESGEIAVSLRSEGTGFGADHFSATCRLDTEPVDDRAWSMPAERMAFDAESEMYREILFQRGRFRRVRGYRLLKAIECVAEIESRGTDGWFSHYLPQDLLLGDAGARDACIHGIQGCIPHMTLLPVSAERITIASHRASGTLLLHARERAHDGNNYLYDIEVRDEQGALHERWDGLLLRAVERNKHRGPWAPPLLGPYIERMIGSMTPSAGVSVAVKKNGVPGRRARSDNALRELLGSDAAVARRGDGRPVTDGEMNVSVAHAGDLTLAVAGPGAVACDIEPVVQRSEGIWRDLLGEERYTLAGLLAGETGEDIDTAATRVWAASESLKKGGALAVAPLILGPAAQDGWVTLASSSMVINTYAGPHGEADAPLVVAVLMGEGTR
jgi:enediyne polyketide synthase